jgi:hypothetical protein
VVDGIKDEALGNRIPLCTSGIIGMLGVPGSVNHSLKVPATSSSKQRPQSRGSNHDSIVGSAVFDTLRSR